MEKSQIVPELEHLAENGDINAQYLMGRMWRDGPLPIPDSVNARYWFEKAAAQGDSTAQYALAKLLLSSDAEVHDSQEGLRWLKIAASNGNSYVAYRLGKEFLKGKIVEQDTDKARECLTQSAEDGNQYAQYGLGKLYLEQQDSEQAHYWFAQSAAWGNKYAQFFLDRWDNLKTPSVMLSATRLLHHMSRVFQEKTPAPIVPGGMRVDRKLLSRIKEKKIAMGHKADDYEEYSGPSMSM